MSKFSCHPVVFQQARRFAKANKVEVGESVEWIVHHSFYCSTELNHIVYTQHLNVEQRYMFNLLERLELRFIGSDLTLLDETYTKDTNVKLHKGECVHPCKWCKLEAIWDKLAICICDKDSSELSNIISALTKYLS